MFMCDTCKHNPCIPGCPNFDSSVDMKQWESGHYCKICGNRIYRGDPYYENYAHEMIHMECAGSWPLGKLLNWFGETAAIMEEYHEC